MRPTAKNPPLHATFWAVYYYCFTHRKFRLEAEQNNNSDLTKPSPSVDINKKQKEMLDWRLKGLNASLEEYFEPHAQLAGDFSKQIKLICPNWQITPNYIEDTFPNPQEIKDELNIIRGLDGDKSSISLEDLRLAGDNPCPPEFEGFRQDAVAIKTPLPFWDPNKQWSSSESQFQRDWPANVQVLTSSSNNEISSAALFSAELFLKLYNSPSLSEAFDHVDTLKYTNHKGQHQTQTPQKGGASDSGWVKESNNPKLALIFYDTKTTDNGRHRRDAEFLYNKIKQFYPESYVLLYPTPNFETGVLELNKMLKLSKNSDILLGYLGHSGAMDLDTERNSFILPKRKNGEEPMSQAELITEYQLKGLTHFLNASGNVNKITVLIDGCYSGAAKD